MNTLTKTMAININRRDDRRTALYKRKGLVLIAADKDFALFALAWSTFSHIKNSHEAEFEGWKEAIRSEDNNGKKYISLTDDFAEAIGKSIKSNLDTIRSFGMCQVAADINFCDSYYRIVIQPVDGYAFHLVSCYKHGENGWKAISETWGTPRPLTNPDLSNKYSEIYSAVEKTIRKQDDAKLYGGCSIQSIFYGR